MDDRRLEVLNQYDFTIESCFNVRGALLLNTDRGLMILRPCLSGEQRLEFEDAVKLYIREHSSLKVDRVCRTAEGKLLSENTYGDTFYVREWFPGEECSLKREDHCLTAVDTLNALHCATEGFTVEEKYGIYRKLPLAEQFVKRTRELKRVKTYIRDKKRKSEFEVLYLKLCDAYYEQALEASEFISVLQLPKPDELIHGNFNYHSLLADALNPEELFAVTSFDKAAYGMQISDFYYLLRKTMEKNNWEETLGSRMIERFFTGRKYREAERAFLKAQLLFPEKFWKITNYYYNNRKSWIPQKNIQKMFSNHDREPAKDEFIKRIFG